MLLPMRAGTAPNAMEARRQRSMSYMLFIMTLMVLLDRRTHRDRMLAVHRQRTGPAHGTNHHEVPAADAPKTAIGGLLAGLDSTLSRCQRAPLPFFANMSGRFRGHWGTVGGRATPSTIMGKRACNSVAVRSPSSPKSASFPTEHRGGDILLHLGSQFFPGHDQFSIVRGMLQLTDGPRDSKTANKASSYMYASVQGTFFGADGRMSLFINSQRVAPPMSVQWTRRGEHNSTSTRRVTVSQGLPRAASGGATLGVGCSFRAELDALDELPSAPRRSTTASSSANAIADSAAHHTQVRGFRGAMWSDNCAHDVMNVTLTAHAIDWAGTYHKSIWYAFMMCTVCVSQIVLLARQLGFADTPATQTKISLLTIGHQALLDAYLCLFHLVAGMVVSPLFGVFVMVSFMHLVLFSVFEMRVMVLIWKARRPQAFSQGWFSIRRELSMLYSRFYCSLMLGIIVLYKLWPNGTALCAVVYSYWIPQIVRNAVNDVRQPLNRAYVLGTSASRMFLPLYLFACPRNIISTIAEKDVTHNGLCVFLVAWTALQVGVLLLQDVLGPRFFVPRWMRPQQYNYRRRVAVPASQSDAESGESTDCPICMMPVDTTERGYLVTPCNHVFHDTCLQQWMEVKLECPSCRAQLPALSSDQVA